jgi:hypothetical protein
VPVAPGLLSTTKGWPSVFCICCATARATVSVEPPAGKGTTTVTAFSGQFCAEAFGASSASAVVASATIATESFFMALVPLSMKRVARPRDQCAST